MLDSLRTALQSSDPIMSIIGFATGSVGILLWFAYFMTGGMQGGSAPSPDAPSQEAVASAYAMLGASEELELPSEEQGRIAAALRQVGLHDAHFSVRGLPVEGWREVVTPDGPAYLSTNARYLLWGTLYDLESGLNMTTVRNAELEMAKSMLLASDDYWGGIPSTLPSPSAPRPPSGSQQLPEPADNSEDGPITLQDVYSVIDKIGPVDYLAPDEQWAVAVFTDPTCPICRRLHKALPDLNRRGLTVRYLIAPRAFHDPDTQAMAQLQAAQVEAALCAENPKAAIDRLYAEEELETGQCLDPSAAVRVEAHVSLASALQFTGTPIFLTDRGKVIRGYADADDLMADVTKKD